MVLKVNILAVCIKIAARVVKLYTYIALTSYSSAEKYITFAVMLQSEATLVIP